MACNGVVLGYSAHVGCGHERCLTPRSSRAPTASHQARSVARYILHSPGLASRRWCRLSSNVRRRKMHVAGRSAIICAVSCSKRLNMSIPMEILAAEALALPAEERSQLLDRLVASLEPSPFDPAWEKEWAEEIDAREAAIASGQASWIPGDEAVARLRARLN